MNNTKDNFLGNACQCIDSMCNALKDWIRKVKHDKKYQYCFYGSWIVMLLATVSLFFSHNVAVIRCFSWIFLLLSFIGVCVYKTITKAILFIISLALLLFVLYISSYDDADPIDKEKLEMEVSDNGERNAVEDLSDLDANSENRRLIDISKEVVSSYLGRKSDWFAIIISVISLIYVAFTWASQDKTRKNTQRVTPEIQKGILLDIFRHSYRNLIVLTALKVLLRQEGYDKYYPAEYHLTKLRTEEESIYPEVFIDDVIFCGRLQELKLFVRNGNLEIKEVINHLKDPNLDQKYKERGIDVIGKRISNIIDRCATVLSDMFDIADADERARQIKKYMFEKLPNTSKSKEQSRKQQLKDILDEQNTERSHFFADLCKNNPGKNGIIDYSTYLNILYPKNELQAVNPGAANEAAESSDVIINSPGTVDSFIKRINAEILKSLDEIHLLPFSK